MTEERTQRERMLAGEPYDASDPELRTLRARAMRLIERYNRSSIDEPEERARILRHLLGAIGDGVEIRTSRASRWAQTSRSGRTFSC